MKSNLLLSPCNPMKSATPDFHFKQARKCKQMWLLSITRYDLILFNITSSCSYLLLCWLQCDVRKQGALSKWDLAKIWVTFKLVISLNGAFYLNTLLIFPLFKMKHLQRWIFRQYIDNVSYSRYMSFKYNCLPTISFCATHNESPREHFISILYIIYFIYTFYMLLNYHWSLKVFVWLGQIYHLHNGFICCQY